MLKSGERIRSEVYSVTHFRANRHLSSRFILRLPNTKSQRQLGLVVGLLTNLWFIFLQQYLLLNTVVEAQSIGLDGRFIESWCNGIKVVLRYREVVVYTLHRSKTNVTTMTLTFETRHTHVTFVFDPATTSTYEQKSVGIYNLIDFFDLKHRLFCTATIFTTQQCYCLEI